MCNLRLLAKCGLTVQNVYQRCANQPVTAFLNREYCHIQFCASRIGFKSCALYINFNYVSICGSLALVYDSASLLPLGWVSKG